jgi:hypothetical protein
MIPQYGPKFVVLQQPEVVTGIVIEEATRIAVPRSLFRAEALG